MEVLIFDFDGPINNLIKTKFAAIEEVSHQLNLSFSKIVIWEIINYIDQIYETNKIYDYEELIKKSLKKLQKRQIIEILDEQINIFSNAFLNIFEQKQIISNSFLDIIKSIKNNYPQIKICIYTSQKEIVVNNIFKNSKIEKAIFDRIYCSEYFDEPKPSILNLKKICDELNVTPNNVVLVGDNVAIDLAPASYLGIKTILINNFVDKQISSLSELTTLLK